MNHKDIEAATVSLPKMGGQGVLIPGRMILTATHCIEWRGDGRMIGAEDILEPFNTKDGRELIGTVVFADPLSDIAVIGGPDDQEFFNEAGEFDSFCDETSGVPISFRQDEPFEKFSIRVLSHRGQWMKGTGKFCHPMRRSVLIETAEPTERGTSGGPVVDENNELVGVVSYAGVTDPPRATNESFIPFACRVLPVWLIDKLESSK